MASRDNQSKQNSGNAQKGGHQKQNQQQAQKKPQQSQQTKTTAAPQRTKKQTADDVLRQKVRQIQNVVPGWTTEDVIRILKDSNGSPEVAIEKMITGEAGHPSEDWQPAKKKKAEKSVKETPKASPGSRNKSGPRGPHENGGQRYGGAGRPDAGRGGRYPDSKPSGGAPGSGGFGPRGAVPQQQQQQRVGGAQPLAQQAAAPRSPADGGAVHLQQPSGPSSVDGGLVATPQPQPQPQQSFASMGVNGQQPTLAQRIAAQTAQQQQRARPPVGAPIGSGPRANGTTAQIAQQQSKPPSEQHAAPQQGRPQATQVESKPAQQTTQQPRPQQGAAAPTAAQVAALKPVTAIQPKGPITAQPVQPVQAAASPQQPAAAATQPIQTQLQTPLLSSSAAQTASSQTPAAAAAASTTQQPSNPQGASTKAYQPFGSSGAAKGSGSGRSSGSSRTAASPSSQWQPKTQQASASAKSPASPPQSALSPAQPISTPSSAQSITTAKEAPQQAAQQAAAAALGAIGQSVPVILPSGLFPSDREEQSLQLQFGNFGLTPAAPPANVLKEETVVPITPVEPVKQQSGPVSVRREETAATASAAASAPVSRPSPVSVSAAAAVSQPSAQTASTARPAAKEPKQAEPAQSHDSNDQSPNLPRKGGNAGGRSGEKKAAAASAAAQHQQQQHYQQQQYQQYQQYQQQHLPQRGLAPPAAVPAAMPAAAEGYDMSAFNAAPLPYPAPFWPAYPMDMAPETQQMFYEYQPTGAYRSGAPVSPEPKYGSGSSSSQSYRDSGKYAQQAGSQSGDADSGPSPRGSSSQPQSQSPPPVQPPHHFGVPGAQQYPHVYGYHYPYSYPAASFTQYQYPQRMPTHYKSPHYASTGAGYPVSPPDSSSLGASSYAEDDYSKYGMPSQSFYETPAAHVSPTMGMKNQHQSLSSSSSKSQQQQQQQQASQMGAYAQQGGADLSGVGASSYKSLGITDYSAQDMSRGSPASSFYSPQFGQQGQYQQQYGFMHHGAHHYQPQQPPHQGQSGQSSGAGQNPQYS